jgi:formylmethanofuran dehydrogenase subunit D
MKAILNTGRTVPQGVAVEHKGSPDYRNAVSLCYVNPVDLMDLGIEEGARVILTSRAGSIVLITRAQTTSSPQRPTRPVCRTSRVNRLT